MLHPMGPVWQKRRWQGIPSGLWAASAGLAGLSEGVCGLCQSRERRRLQIQCLVYVGFPVIACYMLVYVVFPVIACYMRVYVICKFVVC